MTFNNQVAPVKEVRPSARTGCFNFILANGRVLSVQPNGQLEDRDINTDGPFEQGQLTGNVATFNCFGTFQSVFIAMVDKLL